MGAEIVCAISAVIVGIVVVFNVLGPKIDLVPMEVKELKGQIDDLKRMYEEAYSQERSVLEKTSSDQNVNYTQEVLNLIESFHKEISLRRNSSLMNQSHEPIDIELIKVEFQKQLETTKEKIKVVETNTRKAMESVESAVHKLNDNSKSQLEDFRELLDKLRVTVDENREMNDMLMERLNAETSAVQSRMNTFESDLDSVKNELEALGINFTKKVLPNLFNKDSAVIAIMMIVIILFGWNCYMYIKYQALSRSLDEVHRMYTSVSYGGVSGRMTDQKKEM